MGSYLDAFRAFIGRELRAKAIGRLFGGAAAPGAGIDAEVRRLADTFKRYASTQETAYDNGAARPSGGGNGVLERQVDRAIAQVLGRSPGQSGDAFTAALDGAFPMASDGRIGTTPARSVVGLVGTNGSADPLAAAGLSGQLSAEQATLYRQTTTLTNDALRVLAGLQSFSPIAEADRVESLRALVKSEFNSLIEEFGRVDEPRANRVQIYLTALNGPDGHVAKFGATALIDGRVGPVSADDEQQIAGFQLVRSYADMLSNIWQTYAKETGPDKPRQLFRIRPYTERLARASVMMPVIAEANNNFMSAMDSIGFTENERRSTAARFTGIGKGKPNLPDFTVSDLTDWIDRFASSEGPVNLTDSGQYGLEFVTLQADDLFWVFVAVLAHVQEDPVTLSSQQIVAQALTHERVTWSLSDLTNQFNALADLAA
ncbi:MAG TPA: hypothetical protein VGI19_17400 [Candidatus Cybelea sp.]